MRVKLRMPKQDILTLLPPLLLLLLLLAPLQVDSW
jgi:hypothetical protein